MQKTVGIVGAGRIGSSLGALAGDGGWRVVFFDSQVDAVANAPVPVQDARQVTSLAELAAASEIVVLAVPFGAADGLDYAALDGMIVVDPMNYWPATDGVIEQLRCYQGSTTALVASRNPTMRVIKTLNHFAWRDLIADARSVDVPHRRAVVVAGDDEAARARVAELVSDMGFAPVEALAAIEPYLQPGAELFGVRLSAGELAARVSDLLRD